MKCRVSQPARLLVALLLALVVSTVSVLGAAGNAGNPVRIRFKPGAISAELSGHVQPGETDRYVLRALAGQTMQVYVHPMGGPPCLAIYGTDGVAMKRCSTPGLEWSGTLHRSQDYFLDVRGVSSQASYILTVVIPPLPKDTPPIRIRFKPGATEAAVSGRLIHGDSARYILRARRGQSMEIHTASEGYLQASVWGPGGSNWEWPVVERHLYISPLPATGDYIITITAVEKDTPYRMRVVIPPL